MWVLGSFGNTYLATHLARLEVSGMTEGEQTTHFANDIDRLVDRYRQEYSISYISLIGVLYAKATLLTNEACDRSHPEEED